MTDFFHVTQFQVFTLLLDKLCNFWDSDGIVVFGSIKKMWTLMSEHLNVTSSADRLSSDNVSEQSALVMNAMLVGLQNVMKIFSILGL